MHVISPKLLRQFWSAHPDTRGSLSRWAKLAQASRWSTYDEVKASFGKRVDRYRHYVIFDIGGNKYRLIAVIHYNRGRVYLRHVLTHAEYDRDLWKDD